MVWRIGSGVVCMSECRVRLADVVTEGSALGTGLEFEIGEERGQ